jgi:hypothetical protein
MASTTYARAKTLIYADNDIVHQKVFTVRKVTRSRKAIAFIVTQYQNEKKELTLPTIKMPELSENEFESIRFVRDYGCKAIAAADFADELALRVNGNKR